MSVRTVIRYPDERLTRISREVQSVTAAIGSLVGDLIDTALAHGAAGISAPQIGVFRRVLAVLPDPEVSPEGTIVLINPSLRPIGPGRPGSEGCLSLPGVFAEVDRPAACWVKGLNLAGREIEIPAAGELARVLQHEMDHLNGILFWDRLPKREKEGRIRKYGKPKNLHSTLLLPGLRGI